MMLEARGFTFAIVPLGIALLAPLWALRLVCFAFFAVLVREFRACWTNADTHMDALYILVTRQRQLIARIASQKKTMMGVWYGIRRKLGCVPAVCPEETDVAEEYASDSDTSTSDYDASECGSTDCDTDSDNGIPSPI